MNSLFEISVDKATTAFRNYKYHLSKKIENIDHDLDRQFILDDLDKQFTLMSLKNSLEEANKTLNALKVVHSGHLQVPICYLSTEDANIVYRFENYYD